MLKTSERVKLALTGKAPITDDIMPMCDREAYLGALQIIRRGDTSDKRKSMLGRIPQTVRPMVEAHIKRMWPSRNEIRKNPRF